MIRPGTITLVEWIAHGYLPGLSGALGNNAPSVRVWVNRNMYPIQDCAWITQYEQGVLLWVSYVDSNMHVNYGPIAYCRPAEGVLNALQRWVDTGEYVPVEI